ncbi:MAG: T9SS type A sorting domain-containing protein [candidate division Zixibacteria bacterium]|nr:T9SS type A sorting domain-containing protein [candidate division Zixibacteria bacterium]
MKSRFLANIIVLILGIILTIPADSHSQVFEMRDVGYLKNIKDMNDDGALITTKSVLLPNGEIGTVGVLVLTDSAYGLPPGESRLYGLDSTKSVLWVSALNNSGVVIGLSYKADGTYCPTKWVGGQAVEIQNPSEDEYIRPSDINDLGIICGNVVTENIGSDSAWKVEPISLDGPSLVNLWPEGECTDTTRQGSGRKINNSGDIIGDGHCGIVDEDDDIYTNVRWNGIWRNGSLPLEEYADTLFRAYNLNNNGQILGHKYYNDSTIVVILEPGGQQTVFPLPDSVFRMIPASINDLGQVIFTAQYPYDPDLGYTPNRSYLWLPEDAYGLTAGTYNIEDLIDHNYSYRYPLVRTINNQGQILMEAIGYSSSHWYILTPLSPSGFIVNSRDDEPDINPGDGICATVDGDCTLRAAIMESNALPNVDTISFRIICEPILSLHPETELPAITEQVILNGSSQYGGYVEISGDLITSGSTAASGLTISSTMSEISGLLINRFPGAGITIKDANHNLIYNNIIGTDITGLENRGNLFHGIHIINSSDNVIGGEDTEFENRIAYNLSSGIYAQSGQYNSFRNNKIYKNGLLGIDLAPAGVNPNDSLDVDTGANDKLNYPVIDSVVFDYGSGELYGTMKGAPNKSYIIEIFYSDNGDASGYGEGQIPVDRTEVDTNEFGIGDFTIWLYYLPEESLVITAIATDENNNSSEFSQSWPQDAMVLLHEGGLIGHSIKNQKFALSKVTNDRPDFTETFIDTVITNDSGIVNLLPYIASGELLPGDSVKFGWDMHTEPAVKHVPVFGTELRKTLDNAQFDEFGEMSFDELETGVDTQKIVVDHATVVYNLLVSVEWEAQIEYIQSLEESIRNMTNYAYDVTDGQLRFDTVFIVDKKLYWDDADARLFADNTVHPHAHVGGIKTHNKQIEMPRKWYGNTDAGRKYSYVEEPLNLVTTPQYRTMFHEFGHYGLSFYDEYVFPNGGVRCATYQKPKTYGFMDGQYFSRGALSSEMSGDSTYSEAKAGCHNTAQYLKNKWPCWTFFEIKHSGTYFDISFDIKSPNERDLQAGFDYFKGPNNGFNLGNLLNYDVGSLVVFPVTHSAATTSRTRHVEVTMPFTGAPFGDCKVATVRPLSFSYMVQGNTNDNGMIRALGVEDGDYVRAFGNAEFMSKGDGNEIWMYGEGAVGGGGKSRLNNSFSSSADGDSLIIEMNKVEGNLPSIPYIELGDGSHILHLDVLNSFQANPAVDYNDGSGTIVQYDFSADGDNYISTISESLSESGIFIIWATDSSDATFFFDTEFIVNQLATGGIKEILAIGGKVMAELDSTNADIEKAMILSSPYPVIRTGLNPLALQAGETHSLSIYPDIAFNGNNSLRILYADDDFSNEDGLFNDEMSIKIFKWDISSKEWNVVGGVVDTSHNEVITMITETGVYAAFTTDMATDIEDNEDAYIVPDRFEISQNYPNPFNPTTIIEFDLPAKSHVSIEIFNILGQKIQTLLNTEKQAGIHSITWDGKDSDGLEVSSGIYFYRIQTDVDVETKKMILLK